MTRFRRCLQYVTRHWTFRRRLPVRFGRRALWVTPAAALGYFRSLERSNRDLLEFAEHYVPPGSVVWDVGANLGVFAFAAAHCAAAAGSVLAIEADPWMAELMRRSAREPAGGVAAPLTVLCAACAGQTGLHEFATPALVRAGSHLLSSPGAGDDLVGTVAAVHPVVGVSLDWLLERRPAPTVLKIDVEGAELEVLEGGRQLLNRHRPVLLVEVYERSADKITALLHQCGYALHDFSAGWAARRPIERAAYQTLALPVPR